MLTWPYAKDPDSVLTYSVTWDKFLGNGEKITQSEWEVPAPLIKGITTFSDTVSSVQLSGGVDKDDYVTTVNILTDLGNIIYRDVTLKVRNR